MSHSPGLQGVICPPVCNCLTYKPACCATWGYDCPVHGGLIGPHFPIGSHVIAKPEHPLIKNGCWERTYAGHYGRVTQICEPWNPGGGHLYRVAIDGRLGGEVYAAQEYCGGPRVKIREGWFSELDLAVVSPE